MSTDPYSPLMLVVPKGLSPPWRDCFTDGQRDMIHGGTILKDVVQNAKLKQCSRLVQVVIKYVHGRLVQVVIKYVHGRLVQVVIHSW